MKPSIVTNGAVSFLSSNQKQPNFTQIPFSSPPIRSYLLLFLYQIFNFQIGFFPNPRHLNSLWSLNLSSSTSSSCSCCSSKFESLSSPFSTHSYFLTTLSFSYSYYDQNANQFQFFSFELWFEFRRLRCMFGNLECKKIEVHDVLGTWNYKLLLELNNLMWNDRSRFHLGTLCLIWFECKV